MFTNSRGTFRVGAGLVLSCILLSMTGDAQSLAELSRQVRAKKKETAAKEYTNDNIPAVILGSTPEAETPAGSTAAAAKPGEPQSAATAEKKAEEVEKEYRDKAAKLKESLAYEERRLDVLQRELNLTQQQYYSDPNVALREQNSRADINKRTEEINQQKVLVEKAKQAFADLEEELKTKNLPIGWAR